MPLKRRVTCSMENGKERFQQKIKTSELQGRGRGRVAEAGHVLLESMRGNEKICR
jgi:hypothetical protein